MSNRPLDARPFKPILNDGDGYVDRQTDRQEEGKFSVKFRPLPLDVSVVLALGGEPKLPILVPYYRQNLRWMKPDARGRLVPR